MFCWELGVCLRFWVLSLCFLGGLESWVCGCILSLARWLVVRWRSAVVRGRWERGCAYMMRFVRTSVPRRARMMRAAILLSPNGRVAAGMNVQHAAMCTRLCVHDIFVSRLPFSLPDKQPRPVHACASHFALHFISLHFACFFSQTTVTIYALETMLTRNYSIPSQRPGRQLDLRRRQHAHPDPRDDDGPPHRG